MNALSVRGIYALCVFALAASSASALSFSQTLTFNSSGTLDPNLVQTSLAHHSFTFAPAPGPLESVTLTTTSTVSFTYQWLNATNAPITGGVGSGITTYYSDMTGFTFIEGQSSSAPSLVTTQPGATGSISGTFTNSTVQTRAPGDGWSSYLFDGSNPYAWSFTVFNGYLSIDSMGSQHWGTYAENGSATLTYVYATPDTGTSIALLALGCAVLFVASRRQGKAVAGKA